MQVLFENKKAVGLEFIHKGLKKQVFVKKEIILSGGAIGSPQILLLSGIGPKKHLKDLNVSIIRINEIYFKDTRLIES